MRPQLGGKLGPRGLSEVPIGGTGTILMWVCDPAVAINFCVSVACLENGSGLFGQPPAGAVLIRTFGTGSEDARISPESTTAELRPSITVAFSAGF